jgi:hypothetical protein
MENYGITDDASIYFLTYTVVDWLPVFVTEKTCQIITESLCFCHSKKHLRINAYVIMPTHLHLIVFDADHNSQRLECTLADFRKFTGRQLSEYCTKGHLPNCFGETLIARTIADRSRRFWQPSRRAQSLYTEAFWQQKLDYLHDNPRRKGLVLQPDFWRFSSAAWYLSEGDQKVDVPISQIEW